MYAIIKTGGKQYRVKKDDVIDIDLLEAEAGAHVDFDEVLLFNDGKAAKVGLPKVSNCTVKGEVLGMSSGPKITSVKYKRSHNQYRKFGHRQSYTRVKITEVGASSHKHEKHDQQEKHDKQEKKSKKATA